MAYKTHLSAAGAFFALLSVIFFAPETGHAIGQLVAPIVHEDVLRGQIVQDTLTLMNSESRAVSYDLAAEGDIKSWAAFYKKEDLENSITRIEIPALSNIDAVVKLSVPGDIPNGTYTGYIDLMSLPSGSASSGSSASLQQTVSRSVSITVSDNEVVKIESYVLPVAYAVNVGEPLKIVVKHDNQGNIALKPDAQVVISRAGNELFNAIFPYPGGEPAVAPLSMKTLPAIEWPTAGRPEGTYNAKVKIILAGKTIKESDFTFDVNSLPASLLSGLAPAFSGKMVVIWAISAILIIAAIFAAFFVRQAAQKKQRLPKFRG